MDGSLTMLVESFVQRGLFQTPEQAVAEMAREYVLRQVEVYQDKIGALEKKYSMTYEQFDAYLQSRCTTLAVSPSPELNQAVMSEEEDALEWKAAREMLSSWLNLHSEALA